MKQVDYLITDLQRMKDKRERICRELGSGYDWQLVESLIAIDGKIKQTADRIEEVMTHEILISRVEERYGKSKY